ncbi:MAG: hypothetical protein JWS12_794 [Candidatus Saccharibacteria bacterium]|nr:hypothetical protein [Candidatus Saccharibacteria bacterium]
MDAQAEARRIGGALVVRGVAAILFGAAAVFWPGLTLVTLVYLFSAFVLANGLVNLVGSLHQLSKRSVSLPLRALTTVLGALEIGVGVYLLRHPGVSFVTLIILIGFMLIVRGVFEIVAALFDGGSATARTLMVLAGLLAAIVGVVVLFQPETSGVAFVWLLGLYALISGPLLIALALDILAVVPSTPVRAARR